MTVADWLLLAIVAATVFLAFRNLLKKKSCSCGCGNCAQDCDRKQK